MLGAGKVAVCGAVTAKFPPEPQPISTNKAAKAKNTADCSSACLILYIAAALLGVRGLLGCNIPGALIEKGVERVRAAGD
jgi:hypothetical protein